MTAAEKNPDEATLTEAVLGAADEWQPVARDALQQGDAGRWRDVAGGPALELTWIDGELVAEGPVDTASARLGVGSVGGGARFTAIAVRKL